MKERRFEHVYNCSPDVFWGQLFLDEAYNRSLFLDELHFSSWQVLRQEDRGNEVHRVVEATPSLGDLPAVLQKLLSNGLGYEEHGVLDRQNQRYRLEVKPRSLPSKVTILGELTTQPISERACRRIYVPRVEARVLGVGGMVEQRILDDLEKSYNKAAVFTNRWLAERFPQS